MRIGKCPKCKKGELFIIGMNWNGWREYKCKTCGFTFDNTESRIVIDKKGRKYLVV